MYFQVYKIFIHFSMFPEGDIFFSGGHMCPHRGVGNTSIAFY